MADNGRMLVGHDFLKRDLYSGFDFQPYPVLKRIPDAEDFPESADPNPGVIYDDISTLI